MKIIYYWKITTGSPKVKSLSFRSRVLSFVQLGNSSLLVDGREGRRRRERWWERGIGDDVDGRRGNKCISVRQYQFTLCFFSPRIVESISQNNYGLKSRYPFVKNKYLNNNQHSPLANYFSQNYSIANCVTKKIWHM